MAAFHVVPFPADVVRAARAHRIDPWGNVARFLPAVDRSAPCRHCMRGTHPGGDLLLLKFSPFAANSPSPYAERGPIFLCGDECAPYAAHSRLPETVTTRQVNIRAYDAADLMLYGHSQLADGTEAEGVVARLLEDATVRKVHIRTALHGCFLCAVERA